MKRIENRTFDELKPGDAASLVRTLTYKDIEVFAIMSGDINPAHVDEDFAKSNMFHKVVAHGTGRKTGRLRSLVRLMGTRFIWFCATQLFLDQRETLFRSRWWCPGFRGGTESRRNGLKILAQKRGLVPRGGIQQVR